MTDTIETRARAEAEKRYLTRNFRFNPTFVESFEDGYYAGYEQGKADRTYSTADREAVAKAIHDYLHLSDLDEGTTGRLADAALSALNYLKPEPNKEKL